MEQKQEISSWNLWENKMNPRTSAMVDHLVDQGAIKIHSIDEDGQMLYKITDKLREVNPDIYKKLVSPHTTFTADINIKNKQQIIFIFIPLV